MWPFPPTGAGSSVPARAPRWERPRSLRSHLLLIVVIAVLPLLLFSAVTVHLLTQEQRGTLRQGAMDRTLALLTAVDTELERSIATLEALATSEDLGQGRLDGFRRDALRVLESRPEWYNLHLALPSGLQVMNLQRPDDAPFHTVIDRSSFERTVRTCAPVVGSLFREPFHEDHVFPVRVPVTRGEDVSYVLTALVNPGVIDALLAPQGLPPDWVGVVLDASDTIVARTIGRELVGQPAADSLRAALAKSPRGWFRGTTVESWPVYTPYNRSPLSGWSVAIGIPRSAVEDPLRSSLAWLGTLGAVLLGLSITVARLLSRRTARSLELLSDRAEDLGLDRPALAPKGGDAPTGISEVDELSRAFSTAHELIRARSEERDRVEASLRRAEAELRAAEHRKDQFLAILGHELRNPLGVVRTAVQLMRELPAEDMGEPRSMIERQVAHMTRLLDDLLEISRIAHGRIQMRSDLCDLSDIARETADDHRGAMELGGLEVEVSIPDEPLWVRGDRTRLAQTIGNLLQNAHKYTNAGGRVSLRVVEDEGGESATVTVEDTGVGMEPEILEHAFEPFSQADRTISRSRGGLGLGLPLVKGLVEAHGGAVHATSEGSGRGTRIDVHLPLEPALQGSREELYDRGERRTARSRRILVVEDNEMASRSMELFLQAQGHTVTVARSGPEGVDRARSFEPEIVVCDIGLPGLDGLGVARLLRAERDDAVFLIAISGYGQDTDRRKAREAGFDEHLTKPVDLDELRRILSRAER